MTVPNGPRNLLSLTEAELRAMVRSMVLEELVRSVGGESYVGNLFGFEIGQRVTLSKLGEAVYGKGKLEGVIAVPLKSDNDDGYLKVRRDDGSEVLVAPDEIQKKDK